MGGEEVAFEQRPLGGQGWSYADIWGKGIPGRRNPVERLRALRQHDSFWGEMGVVAEQTGSIQITK